MSVLLHACVYMAMLRNSFTWSLNFGMLPDVRSLLGGKNMRRVYTAPLQALTGSFLSAAAFPMAMAHHALKLHPLDIQLPMAAYPPAQQAHQRHSTHSKAVVYRKLYAQYVCQGLGSPPCNPMQSIHHPAMSTPPTLSGTACTLLEETVVSLWLLGLPCLYVAWDAHSQVVCRQSCVEDHVA